MKIVIGIDGGKNGALAFAKGGELRVLNMPETALELYGFLEHLKQDGELFVFLEKVSAFIGEGDEKRFGIIKMLQQVERIKTVLEILQVRTVEVPSVTWQSRLKLNKNKGLSKAERKKKYQAFAQSWAPRTKFTLRQADSVCLLACGLKMLEENDPLVCSEKAEDLNLF